MENQFGAGYKAGPSHQVEPEKEKNPQQEIRQSQQPEAREIKDEKSFKTKLFYITYEPTNRKDISKTGVQYKRKIRGKVEEHIEKKYNFMLYIKSI